MDNVSVKATEATENFISHFGHQYGWCVGLVSICLVLFGWRVTYKNSVKLATRSESKSLIDAINKIINDISDMSLTYWLKSSNKKKHPIKKAKIHRFNKKADDTASESSAYILNILAKTNQAYKLIEILQSRGIFIESNLMSDVIEHATLDCEDIDSFTIEDRTIRAQEAINSCMLVTKSLYDKFQSFYPPINSESLFAKARRFFVMLDKWHESIK